MHSQLECVNRDCSDEVSIASDDLPLNRAGIHGESLCRADYGGLSFRSDHSSPTPTLDSVVYECKHTDRL